MNAELEDSPEFVNESPYENAWMIVVEPSDASEIDDLLTAEAYEKINSRIITKAPFNSGVFSYASIYEKLGEKLIG